MKLIASKYCIKISFLCLSYDYKAGAVTLIVLNLHQDETLVIELQEELKKFDVDQFLLQPGTKNITSK